MACHDEPDSATTSCHTNKHVTRIDYLLWGSLILIVPTYLLHLVQLPYAESFTSSIFEISNKMWWGIVLGVMLYGIIGKIPQELIISLLGKGDTPGGVVRASLAGIILDMCSHGILLVAMRLYERGASLGQVMAFLIASPWNSFSLTLVLWGLVGFKWMITFLLLSWGIAIVSGLIFNFLVKNNQLPDNPNTLYIPDDFSIRQASKMMIKDIRLTPATLIQVFWEGLQGSRMIIRWFLFGIVLAALIRSFVPLEHFELWFGNSLKGLGLTLFAATILEVCSEGTTPIAADILTRAHAPGNSFAFLMTGVATDYTEIMAIRETTRSWKIALFLPLVMVPQVIILAMMLNGL